MNFDIFPNAPTPIYRQIVEQVRRLVASGQMRPGDDLPSVRVVALHHTINPMTVSKAYSLLETEGLLERRRGVGMVIAKSMSKSSRQDKLALLQPTLLSAAQVTRELGISDAQALAAFQTCLNEWIPKETP
ncbi:MAG: GntR family transcriptional regulator [Betaproteobacteria bacterium]